MKKEKQVIQEEDGKEEVKNGNWKKANKEMEEQEEGERKEKEEVGNNENGKSMKKMNVIKSNRASCHCNQS